MSLTSSERVRQPSSLPFLAACSILLMLVESFGLHFVHNPARWNDFRAFYSAGYLLRTQPSHLYDLSAQAAVQNALVAPNGVLMPFYHPSYEALLLAPLSLLPFRAAYGIFMALMVLCLVASFYALRELFSARIALLQPRPGFLLIFSVPLLASIVWGQDSALFLLLCCLTFRHLQRGNDTAAGCVLALALFRFQLAIPLALLIVAYRGRRFAMAFSGTGIGLAALCVSLIGRSGILQLGQLLAKASLVVNQDTSTQQFIKVRPTYMPNLTGLLYALGTRHLSSHLAFLVVLSVSSGLLIWGILLVRKMPDKNHAFALALVCTVLLSYHCLPYDLGLLVPAFALLARRIHHGLLAGLYWLPLVLFATLGGHSLFLYSVPLISLVIVLGNNRFAVRSPLAASA